STGDLRFKVNLSKLAERIDTLRTFSAGLVIDLPKHVDRHLVETLDKCETILLVLESTITSVAAAKRWLKVLGELGYGKAKIRLIVNRSGSKLKAQEAE